MWPDVRIFWVSNEQRNPPFVPFKRKTGIWNGQFVHWDVRRNLCVFTGLLHGIGRLCFCFLSPTGENHRKEKYSLTFVILSKKVTCIPDSCGPGPYRCEFKDVCVSMGCSLQCVYLCIPGADSRTVHALPISEPLVFLSRFQSSTCTSTLRPSASPRSSGGGEH